MPGSAYLVSPNFVRSRFWSMSEVDRRSQRRKNVISALGYMIS